MSRPDSSAKSAVEEDGQLELVRDSARNRLRRNLCPRHVLRAERNERDDVGSPDPRVGSLVPAQVDALLGARDAREQGLGELLLRPDKREDGTVMVDVGVHVEQLGMLTQCLGEGVDGRPITPLGEVRDRFERQLHARHSKTRFTCSSSAVRAALQIDGAQPRCLYSQIQSAPGHQGLGR